MRLRALLLSGMWLSLISSQLHASLIVQGFESGTLPSSAVGVNYSNLGPCVSGWPSELAPEGSYAVTSNAQNCHGLWFPTSAHDGSQFLAVNGMTASGPVYNQTQTGLIVGESYTLSAWFAGLYGLNPPNISWNITSGGAAPVNSFTTNTTGAWQKNGITFTATGSTLTFNITINTMHASGNDLGIDTITLDGETVAHTETVAVTTNPEPGSSLLLGLGLMGLWGLRRCRSR